VEDCGLTACTLVSAPGQTLGNEYGKTLPLLLALWGRLHRSNSFLALRFDVVSEMTSYVHISKQKQFILSRKYLPQYTHVSTISVVTSDRAIYDVLYITWVAAWRGSGIGVGRINEVTLRRARLVLGWMTVSGFNSRKRYFISVCNQPPRSTQPSTSVRR